MLRKVHVFLALGILCLLAGCVEKSGYYDEGQQKTIDDLTRNNGWERSYHRTSFDSKEYDVYELWTFKSDGTGSSKSVLTYDDGERTENSYYFRWSFTIPNFKIIYMSNGLYWEIDKLTSGQLHIYETYDDPLTVPGQDYREYKKFEALPFPAD